MSVCLRPYQADVINRLRTAYLNGKKAPLLVLPTGGGKTVVFSFVTRASAERGNRVLVVAHRRELIKQASHKLADTGVEHGIIAPGFSPTRDPVQIASIQTIGRRLDQIGAFNLIVIDEAHHSVAGLWSRLIAAQPTARLLGVTATPERADGKGLGIQAGGCFDEIVIGPTVADLINGKFLTPARVFAPSHAPDLSGVRIVMGDYERSGLRAAIDVPTLTGDAVEHYSRHAPGAPAIAFCVSVDHAKNVAQAFRSAGWRGVAADGSMPSSERDAAIGGLATGAVQVLCVCDLVSEGLDVPAVSAVLLLRPTKSLGLFLQQVGRGLRPALGKTHLIVLDHAGCTLSHGMPDAEREWSLDGRPRKPKSMSTMQCPTCYAIHHPAQKCPECGHNYVEDKKPGREMKVVPGDLTEIDADRLAALRSKPYKQLLTGRETRDELHEIAKARGYKPGWVWQIMNTRRSAAA